MGCKYGCVYINMYTFFPRESRNVKMVTCLFHLASNMREILYALIGLRNSIFYMFFLSNSLNSVRNFDIDMQLLGAIF